MTPLLVLRPQPGAGATAARARAMGLDPVVAPLFAIRPLAWAPPAGDHDALILTSANAVRCAGPGLALLAGLPAVAVGGATAAAARAAGLDVRAVGAGDASAIAALVDPTWRGRLLHLCGADRRTLPGIAHRVDAVPVYSADAAATLPRQVPPGPLVALVHSPRAAALFGTLVDAAGRARATIALAAISAAAAAAAGRGWAAVAVAAVPTDPALLEVAAGLCHKAATRGEDTSR